VAARAIETSGLGKQYRLGTSRRGYGTLREALVDAARGALRRNAAPADSEELRTIWALDDVSLAIDEGETVGLIGHNGAGKSTLLKILSRITEPTKGWADVSGQVGSLLEVGTGFHPELTGRENIFLNGAILGMRRDEIRRRFDEIVEFAEIAAFLDTPVKRYSSGMSVRLAFSIAAHVEPHILLVDEVLAVGDAAFQRKSLGKMDEVAREGRTVVFVSHNLAIIRALCRRAVLLEHGRAIADAPVAEVIDQYLRALERVASEDLLDRTDRDGRGWQDVLIRRVEIRQTGSGRGEVLVSGAPVTVSIETTDTRPMMECRLTVLNSLGQPIVTFDSEQPAPADEREADLGPAIECHIPTLPLAPGRYRVDVVVKAQHQIQDGLQAAVFFDVEPGVVGDRPMPTSGTDGDVFLPHVWRLPA
jgi:lipopolysaccharide transport system ATP-binding protein